MEYNKGQHCTYLLTYHFVFVVKYRKPVFNDELDACIKDTANRITNRFGGSLMSYESDKDHVHMLVSLPPNTNISTFTRSLKTQTSRDARSKCSTQIEQFLSGENFWSESYFVASTASVSMDVVKKYIESQKTDSHKRKYVKKQKSAAGSNADGS